MKNSVYAVSYISFFDNSLKTKIVQAAGWKDALIKAFSIGDWNGFPDDMEEAKGEAFDGDWMFDVVAIGNMTTEPNIVTWIFDGQEE